MPGSTLHTRLIAFAKAHPRLRTLIGLVGNASFVVGSVFFLFDDLQRAGVWLFVFGSSGMLLESIGKALAESRAGEEL